MIKINFIGKCDYNVSVASLPSGRTDKNSDEYKLQYYRQLARQGKDDRVLLLFMWHPCRSLRDPGTRMGKEAVLLSFNSM